MLRADIDMKLAQTTKDTDEKEKNRNTTVNKKFSFENDSHLRTVFDALNEQRSSTRFCDAVLKVGEREIRAHRSILVAAIPKIFEGQVKKGDPEFTVDLEGLDPNAVEVLVEFVYTGKLLVVSDGVLNLFQAAKTLGMKQVQDSCEKFILEKIVPLDWISLRSFAERNDCPNLKTAIDEFIAHNVEDIFHKKDFFQLPRLQIELATTNNRQEENIGAENLCQMALTWAQKQLEQGNFSLRELLEKTHIMFLTANEELKECTMEDLDSEDEKSKLIITEAQREYIRYTSVEQLAKAEASTSEDEEELTVLIENNKRNRSAHIIQDFKVIGAVQTSDSGCVGVARVGEMLVALSIHSQAPTCANMSDSGDSSSSGEEWVLIAPMSRGRCSVGAVELNGKLYAIGGYDRGDCLNTVEQYDCETNEWMPVTSMNLHRGRLESAVVNRKIFAIGGSNGHTELNTMETYDETSNIWSFGPPMIQSRCSFGTGVIDGRIYAAGGYQGPRNLKSVEVYCPEKGEWTRVAPMNTERNNLCVEALNGKLYAIGGYNGWSCFNSVECYDPEEDRWYLVPPMKTARRGAGAAALHGKLYVIGGSDGTNFLNSVECYDPSTNEWKTVASLNIPRHNVGTVVIKDHIYTVGGFGGTSFLKSIECYDVKNDKWNCFINSD